MYRQQWLEHSFSKSSSRFYVPLAFNLCTHENITDFSLRELRFAEGRKCVMSVIIFYYWAASFDHFLCSCFVYVIYWARSSPRSLGLTSLKTAAAVPWSPGFPYDTAVTNGGFANSIVFGSVTSAVSDGCTTTTHSPRQKLSNSMWPALIYCTVSPSRLATELSCAWNMQMEPKNRAK